MIEAKTMTPKVFKTPVYLHALGWTDEQYCATVKPVSRLRELQPTIRLNGGGVAREKHAESAQLLAPLERAYFKASGVARAKSAARSTVYAATLGQAMAQVIRDQPNYNHDRDKHRVALMGISSSEIIPIFWAYESVGVSDSWANTDTMLFPASIPTAMVTAVSNVTDFHASAAVFGDGGAGVIAAIEHAYLDFVHDRADATLVVAAEEAAEVIFQIMEERERPVPVIDGGAGMVLTRQPLDPADLQINFACVVPDNQRFEQPPGWLHAQLIGYDLKREASLYTSTVLPQLLHEAVLAMVKDEMVLTMKIPGTGTCVIGLSRSR